MNNLGILFSNEIIYALGWTLVHSLWQSSLIAIFVAFTYAVTKKHSANLRYWINATALLACVTISLLTFLSYIGTTASAIYMYDMEITTTINHATSTNAFHLSEIINQHINQIVLCWLAGCMIYALKYFSDLFYCQYVKHHQNTKADNALENKFHELKNFLGITKPLHLRISNLTDVPCVVGHWKPLVLLPASVLLNLSPQQVEVILLHELGHIRRSDYLISTLQNLIRSIYFFNPFIHWMSSNMDEERENACDDIAISVTGDPIFYANTLKEFAEIKQHLSITINLTGRKNMLLNRIKRLFIKEISFRKTYGKAVAVMALFLLGTGFSITGYSTEGKSSNDSFTLKLEDEPLSVFLKLAQDFCPNIPKNIQLKNSDKLVTGNFPDLTCKNAEQVIRKLDDSLSKKIGSTADDSFTIKFENEPLSSFLKLAQDFCPNMSKNIKLKHADKAISGRYAALKCGNAENFIQNLDESLSK